VSTAALHTIRAVGFRVLTDYPRRPILEFYRQVPSPFYGTTFHLDATKVRERARGLERSTYAALVWTFHRALLGIDAFRTRLQGEDVVLHDALQIGMTVPAPRGTFTFCTSAYDEDPLRFLAQAGENMARASQQIDLAQGGAPDFAYYTALPRIPFTSFHHVPLPDPAAGQPETAFGKLTEQGGRWTVPVAVQVNHRYVDGADLGALYEAAVESFARAF
jgi:chloramphenicol O-acetyltransferase type A